MLHRGTAVLFFLIGGAFATVSFFFASSWSSLFDFSLYLWGAQNILSGVDPWSIPNPLNREVPLLATPLSLGLILPLASLDLETAYFGYILLFAALVGSYLFKSFSLISQSASQGLSAVSVLTLIAIPYGAAFNALAWGGMSLFVLLGLALFFRWWETGTGFQGGLFLSLCFIKPHLVSIPLCLLALDCFLRRRWGPLLGVICGVMIATLLVLICCPEGFQTYVAITGNYPLASLVTSSLPNVLYAFFSIPTWLNTGCGLLLSFVFLASRLRVVRDETEKRNAVFALSLPFSVLFAPYSWPHDFLIICPTLLVVTHYLTSKRIFLDPQLIAAVVLLIFANSMGFIFSTLKFGVSNWLFVFPNAAIALATVLVAIDMRRKETKSPLTA